MNFRDQKLWSRKTLSVNNFYFYEKEEKNINLLFIKNINIKLRKRKDWNEKRRKKSMMIGNRS